MKAKLDVRIQHGKLDIDETRVPMGLSWIHVRDVDSNNFHAVYCYREKLPGYALALADKKELTRSTDRSDHQIHQFVYKNSLITIGIFWFNLCDYEFSLYWRNECRKASAAWKRNLRAVHGVGSHNYRTFNHSS